MRPSCSICNCPLDAVLDLQVHTWRYEGCARCREAEKLKMELVEGGALKFLDSDYKTHKLVELTADTILRCRYMGAMVYVPGEECVVAVFKDMVTGDLYGQPV
jgi:hypothetical protein